MYKVKYFDGDEEKIITTFWNEDYIMFDDEGQRTFIMFVDEGLKIIKKGIINFEFIHIIDEEKENNYEIIMNNQNFFGKNMIKTINIEKSKNCVELIFLRDGEKIINRWEKL